MRTELFNSRRAVDQAPRLWRLVRWWGERRGVVREADDRLPWSRHCSGGAEVFHPFDDEAGDGLRSRRSLRAFICVGDGRWQRWRTPVVVERAMVPITVYVVVLERRGCEWYRWVVVPRGGLFPERAVRMGEAPSVLRRMHVRFLREVKWVATRVTRRETPRVAVVIPRVGVRVPKGRMRGSKAVRVKVEFVHGEM